MSSECWAVIIAFLGKDPLSLFALSDNKVLVDVYMNMTAYLA